MNLAKKKKWSSQQQKQGSSLTVTTNGEQWKEADAGASLAYGNPGRALAPAPGEPHVPWAASPTAGVCRPQQQLWNEQFPPNSLSGNRFRMISETQQMAAISSKQIYILKLQIIFFYFT